MSTIKPCIQYKETLDPSVMEVVKVETVVGGTVRSKKIPVFTASYGVEGLLHVIDKFNKTAARLALTPAEKWDQFEEVLDSVAEAKWSNLIQGIGVGAKTNARLNREINNFVHLYAEHDHPRDILLKYIKSPECAKPRKVDPGVHASRIETLCRYANRLNGTEQELTDQQIKLRVFESFPVMWQNDYRKSHRDFDTDTIANIVSYMNLCKGIADDDEQKRGKKRKNTGSEERIRGGGTNKDGKKSGKKVDDNSTCPVHGGHKWKDCSLNPRSGNYGMYQNRGRGDGRFGGRGGRGYGQGNYGRGNNAGRGNGAGRGDYGGRGGAGRGGGRGYGGRGRGYGYGGRGGYHSENNHYEQQYSYEHGQEGQPGNPNGWTQSESYHYNGPSAREGGWHSGRGFTRGGPSSSGRSGW